MARKYIVEIKPLKEALKNFASYYNKMKVGKVVKRKESVGFSNVHNFRKFFSEKRMELLSAIKHQRPKSIYQLAKILNREYKNVHEDVGLLEELGLITKENHCVEVEFEKLCIEVAV